MLVLVPFLNNNSFLSNPTMAQEYDKYGDSSYSQYPTDDKKYECRTGPFEGFFVGSVEFCKFKKFDKDDNKRENRTETRGPPGPQGLQGERGLTGATGATGQLGEDGMDGAQGERGFNGTQGERGFNGTQGIPGTSQITAAKIYKQFGPTVISTLTPENVILANSTATCFTGDIVLSGGYRINSTNPEPFTFATLNFTQIETEPTSTADGWTTEVGTNGAQFTVQSIAHCLDNP